MCARMYINIHIQGLVGAAARTPHHVGRLILTYMAHGTAASGSVGKEFPVLCMGILTAVTLGLVRAA
jgi:hypothetical protein